MTVKIDSERVTRIAAVGHHDVDRLPSSCWWHINLQVYIVAGAAAVRAHHGEHRAIVLEGEFMALVHPLRYGDGHLRHRSDPTKGRAAASD